MDEITMGTGSVVVGAAQVVHGRTTLDNYGRLGFHDLSPALTAARSWSTTSLIDEGVLASPQVFLEMTNEQRLHRLQDLLGIGHISFGDRQEAEPYNWQEEGF